MYYRRNLPHWHPLGADLFVTWRLHDSLPLYVRHDLSNRALTPGRHFREFDNYLDSSVTGPLWLRDARIAGLVVSTLKDVERKDFCAVHAYVVMPNHVHVLLRPAT